MSPARLRAVLFDVDGTLLDSNEAHARSWLDALRGVGIDVPLDNIRACIGMGGDKLLRAVADIDAESDVGRTVMDSRQRIFKAQYLADIAPLPGARALVDRVRARGLTCAVVTSAKKAEAEALLVEAGVADLMDIVVSSDDAEESKPDPDIVHAALQKLSLEPQEAMMIGDTPYDVAAARRASVPILAFRSGGRRDRDLIGALAIYDGPAHLAANLEASPIVRRQMLSPDTPPPISRNARRSLHHGITER